MCGIFGLYSFSEPSAAAFGPQALVEVLLNGLARLEYRGYDSAGLGVDDCVGVVADKPGSGIAVVKEQGKVADLRALCETKGMLHVGEVKANGANGANIADTSRKSNDSCSSPRGPGRVISGIAHTRWATHGAPSRVNAHPQVDDEHHGFVVVHNGIITNYNVLKSFLVERGVAFVSETDTEVIAKLCGFLYTEMQGVGFAELMIEVLSRLNGSYALLVKSTHYPGELIACKKGSPLILGMKQEGGSKTIRLPLSPSKNLTLSPTRQLIQTSQTSRGAILATRSRIGDRVDSPGITHDGKGSPAPPIASTHPISAQQQQYFFSSDPAAIIEHTDQVLVLEDGDMVHINNGELVIIDAPMSAGANPVARKNPELIKLDMNVEQIMKGNYDHFMQKEIFEQPETLLQTMKGRIVLHDVHDVHDVQGSTHANPSHISNFHHLVASSPPAVKLGGLVDHLDTIRRCGRIVIVACGTSYNAGLACRPVLEKLVQMPVSMELASDLLDRPTPIFRNDTCIFMSQSGETADTLRSLELALQRGALCVGITNTVGSAIARRTHCGVHINAGAEIGVASTKAYTSQIVVLLLLALALSGDSISSQDDRQTIIHGLGAVSLAVKKALGLDASIAKLADKLKDEHSLLIFGRGSNYATAIEGALKVKEVSLMHSEGILAGEMKHGPLALVDEHMPIVVIATPDSLYGKMISVIEQLRARGANLIVICSEDDADIAKVSGPDAVLLRVPSLSEYVQPIVNIIPLQLLSYHLAIKRPHKVADVDRPPNLAKSVTVLEE